MLNLIKGSGLPDIFDMMLDDWNNNLLDSIRTAKSFGVWLPFNMVEEPNGDITFTMAVAGYSKENLDVSYADGVLSIEGKSLLTKEPVKYLHRGLSSKNFNFKLPFSVKYEVSDVTLKDGILTVMLKKNTPAVKKLAINSD